MSFGYWDCNTLFLYTDLHCGLNIPMMCLCEYMYWRHKLNIRISHKILLNGVSVELPVSFKMFRLQLVCKSQCCALFCSYIFISHLYHKTSKMELNYGIKSEIRVYERSLESSWKMHVMKT